jgi:hypothetical protein
MDLQFVITAGKTVIFLAIFTWEICPDLKFRKVIIFFSFIPKVGNLAQIFFLFYWHADSDVVCSKYY